MKLLIDTNIWRALADAGASKELFRICRRRELRLVITPAVAGECRRIPVRLTRERVLALIAKPRWYRCMPDAFYESQELIAEISRLRPEWLLTRRNMLESQRLKKDWANRKRGFWSRLKADIDIMPVAMQEAESNELSMARIEAKELRRRVARLDKRGEHTPLTKVYGDPRMLVGDWVGEPVQYWRIPTFFHVSQNLREYANPYTEWMDGVIDVPSMMRDRSIASFFFVEVSEALLKRAWLRASFEFLQTWRAYTDGTPGDSALASHLVDAEYAVSADRNFIAMVERCAREAPFKCANGILMPGGKETVDAFFVAMKSL